LKLQIYTDTIYTPHFRSSYHLRAADDRQFILFFLNSYRQLLIFSGRFWKYHQVPKKVSLNNSNNRYLHLLIAAEMLGQEKRLCSLAALM